MPFRKKQRAAKALGSVAVGMVELGGRLHAQTFGADRSAIGIAGKQRMGVLIERNDGDAVMQSRTLIEIPSIEAVCQELCKISEPG